MSYPHCIALHCLGSCCSTRFTLSPSDRTSPDKCPSPRRGCPRVPGKDGDGTCRCAGSHNFSKWSRTAASASAVRPALARRDKKAATTIPATVSRLPDGDGGGPYPQFSSSYPAAAWAPHHYHYRHPPLSPHR